MSKFSYGHCKALKIKPKPARIGKLIADVLDQIGNWDIEDGGEAPPGKPVPDLSDMCFTLHEFNQLSPARQARFCQILSAISLRNSRDRAQPRYAYKESSFASLISSTFTILEEVTKLRVNKTVVHEFRCPFFGKAEKEFPDLDLAQRFMEGFGYSYICDNDYRDSTSPRDSTSATKKDWRYDLSWVYEISLKTVNLTKWCLFSRWLEKFSPEESLERYIVLSLISIAQTQALYYKKKPASYRARLCLNRASDSRFIFIYEANIPKEILDYLAQTCQEGCAGVDLTRPTIRCRKIPFAPTETLSERVEAELLDEGA